MHYRQPYTRVQAVPAPKRTIAATAGLVGKTSRFLSLEKRVKETAEQAELRVKYFMLYADKYKLPISHEDLKAENNEKDPALRRKFERICSEVEGDNDCRPFSALYFDKNEKLIFCYLGFRWKDDMVGQMNQNMHAYTYTE
jgi:hypothetical protein